MGHYDDQREAYEQERIRDRAKARGLTVEQLLAKEKHEARMARGRMLFLKRISDEADIDYYLQNK